MSVLGISAAGLSHAAAASQPRPATQKFGVALKAAQQKTAVPGKPAAAAGKPAAQPTAPTAARTLDQLTAAQARMEEVLKLAQSGKSFTPAELLSLQTQVYRASQELDLAGKVVEKATGGVKQVLQTQV
jgi:hypothetical protein